MEIKKSLEILIERHEVTIIRRRRGQAAIRFCEICQTTSKHFSVSHAAFVRQISETAIFRLVENGQIHSTETPAGIVLVCSNSLFSGYLKGVRDE